MRRAKFCAALYTVGDAGVTAGIGGVSGLNPGFLSAGHDEILLSYNGRCLLMLAIVRLRGLYD
jgi:hypothetical protein